VSLLRLLWIPCNLLLGAAVLAVWAAVDFSDYLVERQLLANEAAEVTTRASNAHEIAEAVAEKVQTRVSPGDRDVLFLRSSPLDSWVSGEGHCGDAARVIVLMLRSVGVEAHRIYLRADADDYFHVAVAYRVGEHRYLADSVNSTREFRRFIAANRRRALDQIGLPNEQFYSYSYVNWGRVPPFVQIDQKTPPPSAVAVLIESPSLLLALLKLGVVGGALVSACLCGVSGSHYSSARLFFRRSSLAGSP
jgi:hypothetical protein